MRDKTWLIMLPLLSAGAWLVAWLTVAAAPTGPWFSDSGQQLGNDTTYAAALVDVEGDNDLDLITGDETNNRIWLNDGAGNFSDSGQQPGSDLTGAIVAGDLNGDQAPDLVVANRDAGNQIWLNDGAGQYSWDGGRLNPAGVSYAAALADFDGDVDLDLFVANDGANTVWLNDGQAALTLAQTLGSSTSRDVVVGDVDGDLDLDVYVANGNPGASSDELWLNEAGSFSPSPHSLSTAWNEGVALADLDGDDDLDLFLAAWTGPDAVWLNDGHGAFTATAQSLGTAGSLDVQLLDLDGDEDLDAVVAKWVPGRDEIWLNDGAGNFTLSGQLLDDLATYAIAAGDLDNDFDQDLVLANFGPNGVWLRGGAGTPTPWFELAARQNLAGQPVYPWVGSSGATLPVRLSGAPVTPLTVLAEMETPTGLVTETIAFGVGQQSATLTVTNPAISPSQPVTLLLSVLTSRAPAGVARFNPLTVTFIDGAAGDAACSLCYADWLLKLLGFETTFWTIHHMQFSGLRETLAWHFYSRQFATHSQELSSIIALHPALLWQSYDTLELWTPALAAVDDGQGQNFMVTTAMATAAQDLFTGVQAEASPALADLIDAELNRLDFPGAAGQPVGDLVQIVSDRVTTQRFLPAVPRR